MKTPRKKLIEKLDKAFSVYIRTRNANLDGFVECITCGTVRHWKQMQCGHFMSRGKYATRWNEINCQVQCDGCNRWKQGEQYKFSKWLDAEYGEGTSDELVRLSNTTAKFSDSELEEMLNRYLESF